MFLSINYCDTHPFPLKHFPGPQSQIFTSWLLAGEQQQAPIRHILGKSPADLQHIEVATVPPAQDVKSSPLSLEALFSDGAVGVGKTTFSLFSIIGTSFLGACEGRR
jgi:hypothetical protein